MTEDDMKFIKYVIGAINPGTSWEGGGGRGAKRTTLHTCTEDIFVPALNVFIYGNR